MSDDVLLRCSYFKQPDGSYLEVRYFGRHIMWAGLAPVVLFHLADLPWGPFRESSPSLALVKEGPKALVLYRGLAAASQPCILA